jgi:type II secretory pathway component PulK
VLIMTVLVLAVVAIVGYAFSYSAGVSRRTALNARDAFRRDCAVDSALHYALAVLWEDTEQNDFDSLGELWAEPEHSIEVAGVPCTLWIVDADRRLNVNRGARIPRDAQRYPDLRRALYGAVLQAGGQDRDYHALRQWVIAREPLMQIWQIRQAPLVTRDIFEERPDKPSLLRLLTTHSRHINVNTAPREILNSLWDHRELTERLLERRQSEPFKTREDLEAFFTRVGAPQRIRRLLPALDVASEYFTVRVRDSRPGPTTSLTAFVRRQESAVSPLYVRRQIEEEQP